MPTIIIHLYLPDSYCHNHFEFTVEIKSDTKEIQRQTERLDTAGKELNASIAANTPQTQTKKQI